METVLQVENLRTSFMTGSGEVQAVRGVSFSVEKGEILGIVGESGSGKSVTSMSVLRLLADTAVIKEGSSIVFEGEDLLKLSGKQIRNIRGERISMIFQDPMTSLNPLIPVGKQVEEMMRIHHPDMKKEDLHRETVELFEKVRIPEPEKRLKNYPHEFSGGMMQRVSIALALIFRPRLLIMDEATTALDVVTQTQILNEIMELEKTMKIARIMITHDMSVVSSTCKKVVVMYAGRIMEQGRVEDVLVNPLHPYTQGLMNSFPSFTGEKTNLRGIPGSLPDMSIRPTGCVFADRCPKASRECREHLPELRELGNGRKVACGMCR